MVAIDKRKTSQRLTLNHRCLVRTRKRPDPHVLLAGDLTNSHQVLLSAQLDDVPGPEPVTRERAELLGWYIAEGTAKYHQARIVQSLSRNKDKVDRIRSLLEADGADFTERNYRQQNGNYLTTFTIKGELAEWLNLHHKRLPVQYVTTWPLETVRALYNGLIDGDGHRRASGGVLFHQKDRHVVDAMQIIALRLGLRCSVTYQPTLGASRGVGGAWQATIGQGSDAQRWTKARVWDGVGIPRETYTGTVWCPQVETTFWLARRDGRTFITGNSLGDKERPATSYVIVACTSANRYFDLDAVRTPPSSSSHARGPKANDGMRVAPEQITGSRNDDGEHHYHDQHPAGAPPRDWWHQVDAIIDAEIDRMAGKYDDGARSRTGLAKASKGIPGGDTGNPDKPIAAGGYSVGARGVHIRRALEAAGILSTLEALDISPRGYKGAHYAVFPKELVRLLVDEMAPRRVCTECGEPSRRIVGEVEYRKPDGRPHGFHGDGFETNESLANRRKVTGHDNGNMTAVRPTLGWSDCGHNDYRPGLVLDPFVGSGTTLEVCTPGFDCIGIDIDPRNADLAAERVGMFLEVDEREVSA